MSNSWFELWGNCLRFVWNIELRHLHIRSTYSVRFQWTNLNKRRWWIDVRKIMQYCSLLKKQIRLKEYQHTNECCLSRPILTKHNNNLRIRKFSSNYTKPELALSFGHAWVLVSSICLSFSSFMWSLCNLDTTLKQG